MKGRLPEFVIPPEFQSHIIQHVFNTIYTSFSLHINNHELCIQTELIIDHTRFPYYDM